MKRRLAVILLLLLAASLALTLAAWAFGIFTFDLRVALWLRGVETPAFEAVMAAISFLGDGWIPVVIVLLVSVYWAFRKGWLEAAFVLATLSAGVLAGVLKVLVGRPRPPSFSLGVHLLFPSFNQYSYPSGHVLLFVVFYGFVAYLAWKYLAGRSRWIVIAVCAALIILIGPSRLVVGAHWASDVIGSYLIGTLWLIILILLYLMVLFRRAESSDSGQVL